MIQLLIKIVVILNSFMNKPIIIKRPMIIIILDLCEPVLIRTLLFASNSFDTDTNTNVLNATIEILFLLKV